MPRVTPKLKGWNKPQDVSQRTGAAISRVYVWLREDRPDYPQLESKLFNGVKHVNESSLRKFCALWSLELTKVGV